MNQRPTEKRGNVLVERRFQLRFIFTFVSILVMGAVLSGALLYFILTRGTGMAGSPVSGRALLVGIAVANGVSLVLLLYPTTRVTLRTSHQLGGPLRRFQNIASSIKEGNFEVSTQLRDGDQLTAMAFSLGEMVAALKERISALQKKSDVLTATIDATARKAEQDVYLKSNIFEDLQEIRRQNHEIIRELLRYKL